MSAQVNPIEDVTAKVSWTNLQLDKGLGGNADNTAFTSNADCYGTVATATFSIIETNKMDAIIRMYLHNRHRKNQK